MLKAKGLYVKIAFPNGIRADLVNDHILNLFKEVGVYRLAYSIESGSLNIQKKITKNLNLEEARHNINLTVSKGISTHGFFMMGFLNETKEEMLQTIDYAAKSKLHTASFSFVIPQPGTQLYYDAVKNGYNFEDLDTDQLNPGDTEINISSVSTVELHKLRRAAYKKFYLNPIRIFRIWQTTPQKSILLKSLLVFLTNILPISITMREKIQGILYR